MAHELGFDGTLAVEALFEGEDDQHAVDTLLHPAQPAVLPGPKLGADEPDHRHAGAAEVPGEPEVYVREVDQHGYVGPSLREGADEAAVARVDPRYMAQDLRYTHHGHIFGADDALLAGGLHGAAPQTGEGGGGQLLAEPVDQVGTVGVAGGLAGGEEDARVGVVGDGVPSD